MRIGTSGAGLLLVNEGLVEAARLAPRERWLEALRRVYGE